MYVLEATKETQSEHDDDYVWTIDGELVFIPRSAVVPRAAGVTVASPG